MSGAHMVKETAARLQRAVDGVPAAGHVGHQGDAGLSSATASQNTALRPAMVSTGAAYSVRTGGARGVPTGVARGVLWVGGAGAVALVLWLVVATVTGRHLPGPLSMAIPGPIAGPPISSASVQADTGQPGAAPTPSDAGASAGKPGGSPGGFAPAGANGPTGSPSGPQPTDSSTPGGPTPTATPTAGPTATPTPAQTPTPRPTFITPRPRPSYPPP